MLIISDIHIQGREYGPLEQNREVISLLEKNVKDNKEALKAFLEALEESGHQHVLMELGLAISPGKKIF